MALIKCHECGHEISSTAKVCPNCGATPMSVINKRNTRKKTTRTIFLSILSIIALVYLYNVWNPVLPWKWESKYYAVSKIVADPNFHYNPGAVKYEIEEINFPISELDARYSSKVKEYSDSCFNQLAKQSDSQLSSARFSNNNVELINALGFYDRYHPKGNYSKEYYLVKIESNDILVNEQMLVEDILDNGVVDDMFRPRIKVESLRLD